MSHLVIECIFAFANEILQIYDTTLHLLHLFHYCNRPQKKTTTKQQNTNKFFFLQNTKRKKKTFSWILLLS